jgi:hypothetical protein
MFSRKEVKENPDLKELSEHYYVKLFSTFYGSMNKGGKTT